MLQEWRNGTEKAEALNEQTWKYVARRGMVSDAYFIDGEWKPEESDNDGLWTSMYAGGELMRYATLKNDPNATPEQIEEARKTATLSTEAVLFLTYISMRQGTVESYNRAQRSGTVVDLETGKYYTSEATLVGGDYSQNVPFKSPAAMFDTMYTNYLDSGEPTYVQVPEENLKLFNDVGWANPMEKPDEEYDMRTRNLEGFWSRTYSFRDENNDYDSFAYWSQIASTVPSPPSATLTATTSQSGYTSRIPSAAACATSTEVIDPLNESDATTIFIWN